MFAVLLAPALLLSCSWIDEAETVSPDSAAASSLESLEASSAPSAGASAESATEEADGSASWYAPWTWFGGEAPPTESASADQQQAQTWQVTQVTGGGSPGQEASPSEVATHETHEETSGGSSWYAPWTWFGDDGAGSEGDALEAAQRARGDAEG
ncbi:MAG: hypothetical protein ACFCUQ_14995, partial [Kiloniellales bacterium]